MQCFDNYSCLGLKMWSTTVICQTKRLTILILLAGLMMIWKPGMARQKKGYEFFVQNGDTTFCTQIIFFSSDTCQKIKWYDNRGIGETIECIRNNRVTSFSMNGRVYELLRVKKEKKRYFWRKIDGMIKLYVQDFTETRWYDQNMPETETQKFVMLHDNLYRIRKKRDIKRYLLPTFVACEGFRTHYYGKFSMDELDNMIKVYNAKCVYQEDIRTDRHSDYLVDQKGDTIHCLSVEIKRSSGMVSQIRYTIPEGRVYTINGRNECEAYRTFSINKQVYDLIPVEPGEPSRGRQHVWRKIDGRLKLYDYFREARGMEKGVYMRENDSYNIILYTVQLDDDVFVEVTDKNLNKTITPYLGKCSAFAEIYKDEVTTEREVFELVVKLYNIHCPYNGRD